MLASTTRGRPVDDARWMREAIALAQRGQGATRPNPPVGAVVVRGGRAVGRGWHRKAGGPHAEVFALRQAGDRASGATLYVTLEPCSTWGRTPPCTDAIVRSRIRRVVVAVHDPNPAHDRRGLTVLRKAGIRVTTGVCHEEGSRLIAPFATWIASGRPFVTLKLGMSLDGRIADTRGKSKWITGERSRDLVHALRQEVDAVMVGGRTARADNPSLLPKSGNRSRLYRVIVDSSGKLPLSAQVLTDGHAAQTIVAVTESCSAAREARYIATGARVWRFRSQRGQVPLARLLSRLGKLGLLHVVAEGGGELAASLAGAGLVDEYLFFVAPLLLGGPCSIPAIGGKGWRLGAAPALRFVEIGRVGCDVMIRAVPRTAEV